MTAALAQRIDAAVASAARQRRRPRRDVAAALAAAAARWRADEALAAALPAAAALSPAMVAAVLPLAAGPLAVDSMAALVERELGPGAAGRGAPAGPKLVVQILASNVPALGVPAIALACLAGVATVVKSGRADPLSAPAFHHALAAVDPELAATVVAAHWRGGDRRVEDAVLARAGLVVASGSDATLAALTGRTREPLVAHGTRTSVAAVGRDAPPDAAERLALDAALYDQRGCLSPREVWVEGDADTFAVRLTAALQRLAADLPPGPAPLAERAAARVAADEAEWDGAPVVAAGGRTVAVHAIDSLAALAGRLAPGTIECVGVAGALLDVEALRRIGIARVCPVGRMQRPRLSWPRGQRPPLRALLGIATAPLVEIEP
ncbi:MAG TPA: acyl-CoA reductase [Candidatus Binatia bacterium]|nr:acyl-CoA reductase [Candidatus Binatia bacterium]